MAKKKTHKKNTDVVILIRIPDATARHGEATLTIQRGTLGHIHEFSYSGLTLKGNIAEAVQTALLKLTKVEATPPPELSTETTEAADESTVEPDADSLDDVDADDTPLPNDPNEDEIEPEVSEDTLPAVESGSTPMDTGTDDTSLDEAENVPQKVSVSAMPEISVTPSDNQQMNLF